MLRIILYNIFAVFFLGLRRQKSPKRPKKSSMKRRLHCLKVILWSIKEKWKKRKGFIKPGKHCLPQWNRRKKKKRRSRPGKYCKIHYTVWTVKSVIFSFTCKGQLISKCPFGVFKFLKQLMTFFPGFLPYPLKRGLIKKVVSGSQKKSSNY